MDRLDTDGRLNTPLVLAVFGRALLVARVGFKFIVCDIFRLLRVLLVVDLLRLEVIVGDIFRFSNLHRGLRLVNSYVLLVEVMGI